MELQEADYPGREEDVWPLTSRDPLGSTGRSQHSLCSDTRSSKQNAGRCKDRAVIKVTKNDLWKNEHNMYWLTVQLVLFRMRSVYSVLWRHDELITDAWIGLLVDHLRRQTQRRDDDQMSLLQSGSHCISVLNWSIRSNILQLAWTINAYNNPHLNVTLDKSIY